MASAPQFKVYNPSKEYVAACKHVEDAAALVALYGDGATIRSGHTTIVWTEGQETQPAGESFDFVAELAHQRLDAIWQRALRRMSGEPDGLVSVPGFGTGSY